MLLDFYELEKVVNEVKRDNKQIVFVNGCFDLFHMGHLDLLNQAAALADILIVGVNSDDSVKTLKGNKRPIISQLYRSFIIDNIRCVDYTTIFDDKTPKALIEMIKPDIMIKGEDYKKKTIEEMETIIKQGIDIRYIDNKYNMSTSAIIERIMKIE